MRRTITAMAVAAAAFYGRHMYLEGFLAGRKDLFDEMERLDKRYRKASR